MKLAEDNTHVSESGTLTITAIFQNRFANCHVHCTESVAFLATRRGSPLHMDVCVVVCLGSIGYGDVPRPGDFCSSVFFSPSESSYSPLPLISSCTGMGSMGRLATDSVNDHSLNHIFFRVYRHNGAVQPDSNERTNVIGRNEQLQETKGK